MRWEINVSRDGQHFFATHPRSITNEQKCISILVSFLLCFDPAEGYKIKVTRWDDIGLDVTDEIAKRAQKIIKG
jgi:hypothetical protein